MRFAVLVLAFAAQAWGGVIVDSSAECSFGSTTVSDPQHCILTGLEARTSYWSSIAVTAPNMVAAGATAYAWLGQSNSGSASSHIDLTVVYYTAGPPRPGWLSIYWFGEAGGDTHSGAGAHGRAAGYDVWTSYCVNPWDYCHYPYFSPMPPTGLVPFHLGVGDAIVIHASADAAVAQYPYWGSAVTTFGFSMSLFEFDRVTPVPVSANPLPEPGTALIIFPLLAMALSHCRKRFRCAPFTK